MNDDVKAVADDCSVGQEIENNSSVDVGSIGPTGPLGNTGDKVEPQSRGGRTRKPKGQRFCDVLDEKILVRRREMLAKKNAEASMNALLIAEVDNVVFVSDQPLRQDDFADAQKLLGQSDETIEEFLNGFFDASTQIS